MAEEGAALAEQEEESVEADGGSLQVGDEDIGEDEEDDDVGSAQAVSVVVRIRPLLPDEAFLPNGQPQGLSVAPVSEAAPNTLRVVAREGTPFESVLECSYDQVLTGSTQQAEVFESTPIKPAVLGVAHGISACIFAYGQTSAGKTHTMIGEDPGSEVVSSAAEEAGGEGGGETGGGGGKKEDDREWGLIPRAVRALFEELDRQRRESGQPSPGGASVQSSAFRSAVHCSMLQIYNENLHGSCVVVPT